MAIIIYFVHPQYIIIAIKMNIFFTFYRNHFLHSYRNPQLSKIQKENLKQRKAEIDKPIVIKRRILLTTTTFIVPQSTAVAFNQIQTTTVPVKNVVASQQQLQPPTALKVEEVNTMISDGGETVETTRVQLLVKVGSVS